MKKGATRKITINVDSAIISNLNNALDLVVHVKVNNVVMIKYKKGGTGEYTPIVIDGTTTTRCYAYIDRDQSTALGTGLMTVEVLLRVTDANYGADGKAIAFEAEIDKVYNSSTIDE